MEVIYLLIPISLLLVAAIIYFLFWAIQSGQFDDLDGAGFQILMDDDKKVTDEPDDPDKETEDSI
jgi:cbb3-type cytochrome oxidase maturation protein